ncbi:MAG: hypothetical protein IPI49_08030 [Myxococcales bacterium]|nr:hypothetical protein [Myxococcales bacterium]
MTPTEHRRALLAAACRETTIDHIKKYTICIDPGYPTYVAQLTTVLQSGGRRGINDVDWEPIFHAIGGEPVEDVDLRWYRLFLAAIGCLHPLLSELLAPNAIAITIVEESSLESPLARLCYHALEETAQQLSAHDDRETAFVLLGCLLVAGDAAMDAQVRPLLESRLRQEEARHHGSARPKGRPAFLWTCTRAREAFPRWERCIARALPSASSSHGLEGLEGLEGLRDLRAELLGP